jgi:hypothetical protein
MQTDKSKALRSTSRLQAVLIVPPEELVVCGRVVGEDAAQEGRLSAEDRALGTREAQDAAVRPPEAGEDDGGREEADGGEEDPMPRHLEWLADSNPKGGHEPRG